eukprot:EG_transcript_25071
MSAPLDGVCRIKPEFLAAVPRPPNPAPPVADLAEVSGAAEEAGADPVGGLADGGPEPEPTPEPEPAPALVAEAEGNGPPDAVPDAPEEVPPAALQLPVGGKRERDAASEVSAAKRQRGQNRKREINKVAGTARPTFDGECNFLTESLLQLIRTLREEGRRTWQQEKQRRKERERERRKAEGKAPDPALNANADADAGAEPAVDPVDPQPALQAVEDVPDANGAADPPEGAAEPCLDPAAEEAATAASSSTAAAE